MKRSAPRKSASASSGGMRLSSLRNGLSRSSIWWASSATGQAVVDLAAIVDREVALELDQAALQALGDLLGFDREARQELLEQWIKPHRADLAAARAAGAGRATGSAAGPRSGARGRRAPGCSGGPAPARSPCRELRSDAESARSRR